MMTALFWLVVGHVMADFPLQGDFLAKAKNHRTAIAGIPWWLCLAAHTIICGAGVALVLGPFWGMVEAVVHYFVDYAKNEGWFGGGEKAFVTDQAIHLVCRLVYAAIAIG